MSNWFSMYTYRELVLYWMGFVTGACVVLIPILMRTIARINKRTEKIKAKIRELESGS